VPPPPPEDAPELAPELAPTPVPTDPATVPAPRREPPADLPAPTVATRAPRAVTTASPTPARIVLFDTDGSLRVPEGVLDAGPEPVASYIPVPRDAAPWEQRIDPMVYEPTAFEEIWKPDQESLMGEFFRRSTVTKTFKTPWGTKVTCSWVLIVGGCGW
jgi:hypothetical protein